MIQLNNLHKYYNKGKQNEIHVINGTTLSLPERGFVCILGESGSGKTTLLNTMGGLDDFKQGSLSIAGKTLQHYSSSKIDKIRTKHCAYIFQNYYLLQEHTVEYNIHLALDMYTLSEEEKQSRIDYVLQAVDMQKYKKRVVSHLSGGQQHPGSRGRIHRGEKHSAFREIPAFGNGGTPSEGDPPGLCV